MTFVAGLDDPFQIESEVRAYCRHMPATFDRAENSEIWDKNGVRYIDFLAGCGAVNYGHNNPELKRRLVDYIVANGITTSLDLQTVAKGEFLEALQKNILEPRKLTYKVQFPGPTGTNSVEAALKLARKFTKRHTIVAFSNAFHGMTLGALAATGNRNARSGAGIPLSHVHRLPFEGYCGATSESLIDYERAVQDPSSGLEPPAAFIVEAIQGEGGLNVASNEWLQTLSMVAKRLGALLIVDDIQAGCGRTGTFFSFEQSGIVPDIICLSKSISGFGLPLSLVLIRPKFDIWSPGEHNGTFRGNNLAFVTATGALSFWREPTFSDDIQQRERIVRSWVEKLAADYAPIIGAKGRGLMQGFSVATNQQARSIARRAFDLHLLIECCGPHGNILKIMPPLTIPIALLLEGLQALRHAVDQELRSLEAVRFAA